MCMFNSLLHETNKRHVVRDSCAWRVPGFVAFRRLQNKQKRTSFERKRCTIPVRCVAGVCPCMVCNVGVSSQKQSPCDPCEHE